MLALLALVVASADLAQTSAGHSLLRGIGISQAPPTYTELAFTDPQALPTRLGSKHASVDVSFGIHNVSGSPRPYRWSILLVRSGHSLLKATGQVTTSAQGRVTVHRSLASSCVGGRLQVVARLAVPAQSIDFWVACWSDSRSTQ